MKIIYTVEDDAHTTVFETTSWSIAWREACWLVESYQGDATIIAWEKARAMRWCRVVDHSITGPHAVKIGGKR